MPKQTQLTKPEYYQRMYRALDAGKTPEEALRAARVLQPERACHVFTTLGADLARRQGLSFDVARYTIRPSGTHVVPIINGTEIDATGTDPSSLTDRHLLSDTQKRFFMNASITFNEVARTHEVASSGDLKIPDAIAAQIAEWVGVEAFDWKRIGAGTDGVAFQIGPDQVLKVTTTPEEASAAEKIKGKSFKHLVKVIDVQRFGKFAAIVMPMYEKLSHSETQELDGVISLPPLLIAKMTPTNWEDVLREYLITFGDEPEPFIADLKKYQFPEMLSDLLRAGIRNADIHAENVMKRGSDYVLIDMVEAMIAPITAGKDKKAKKQITFAGLPVGIEYDVGDLKKHKDGTQTPYWYAYGFIKGTKADDQGSVDVYLGWDQYADNAYVVRQNKRDGTYDEDKVMLGFPSEQHARDAYLTQYPLSFFGGIAHIPMQSFRPRYLAEFDDQKASASTKRQHSVDQILDALWPSRTGRRANRMLGPDDSLQWITNGNVHIAKSRIWRCTYTITEIAGLQVANGVGTSATEYILTLSRQDGDEGDKQTFSSLRDAIRRAEYYDMTARRGSEFASVSFRPDQEANRIKPSTETNMIVRVHAQHPVEAAAQQHDRPFNLTIEKPMTTHLEVTGRKIDEQEDQIAAQVADFIIKAVGPKPLPKMKDMPKMGKTPSLKDPPKIKETPEPPKVDGPDKDKAKADQEVDPDKYHEEHGKCPPGYNWDGKNCAKVGDAKPLPEKVEPTKPQKKEPKRVTKKANELWNKSKKLDREMDERLDKILPEPIKNLIGNAEQRQKFKQAGRDFMAKHGKEVGKAVVDSYKESVEDYKQAGRTIRKMADGEEITTVEKLQLAVTAGEAAMDVATIVTAVGSFGTAFAFDVGLQGLKQAGKTGAKLAIKSIAKHVAKDVAKRAGKGAMTVAWKEFKNSKPNEQKSAVRKLLERYGDLKQADLSVKKWAKKKLRSSFDIIDAASATDLSTELYVELIEALMPVNGAEPDLTEDEIMQLLYMDWITRTSNQVLEETMDLPADQLKSLIGHEADTSDKFTEDDVPGDDDDAVAMVLAEAVEELERRGDRVLADESKLALLKKLTTLDNFQKVLKLTVNIIDRAKKEGTPGKQVLEAIRVFVEEGTLELAEKIAGDDEDLKDSILDVGALISSLLRRFGRRYADDIFNLLARKLSKNIG